MGIEGIWNDNNEFSIPDDLHALAKSRVGHLGRAYLTVEMASASYEAMTEHSSFNDHRKVPFLITRAGAPGSHCFAAQTWSGDNYTSWHTLKHNIPMGLNAGLCLMSGYGHDIGGFAGPVPDAELLLRWIQNG